MIQRNQRGFTLVEIVVASTIMIIGMSMFAMIVSGIVKKNFHSRQHTQAVLLAQNKIEELLNEGYNSNALVQGSYVNPDNPVTEIGEPDGIFEQSWEIEDVNPIPKAKMIFSKVVWLDMNDEEQTVVLTAVSIDESN